MTDGDMFLLSETFPKLQWECGCGLGVKKCIGAIERKIDEASHPIFLQVVSCLKSHELGVAMITEANKYNCSESLCSHLCLIQEEVSMKTKKT